VTLPTCWVITDGKAGMENQCLGLAEALGLQPAVKHVRLRAPWRQLTPYVRIGGRLQFAKTSDPLAPPWPDLLIATGRHSVAASLYVHKSSARTGKRTVTVQLQNPVIAPSHFDLVVVPRHDRLTGPNIVTTRGALNRITPAVLAGGAARLAPGVMHLARPYIVVLLGGANAAYRFGTPDAARLGGQLCVAARAQSGSLLVTPSRRTGAAAMDAFAEAIGDTPHCVWNGEGENPYFGMLGLADFIVVTADSVNMVSEAASTGKPLYVFDPPGGTPKFDRFHRGLRDDGIARAFTGTLEDYSYVPLDDAAAVVERVRALLRRE
jgi:mitochondrial fission protein ELM1